MTRRLFFVGTDTSAGKTQVICALLRSAARAGISAVPFWNVKEKLQWISDFEFAGSAADNGVFLPTRYEALAPGAGDASGDAYFAGYTGLTYFIRGHNLKLMSGVKYTHMHGGPGGGDFNGWTWLGGVRMAF